jgi:hypothetical protein
VHYLAKEGEDQPHPDHQKQKTFRVTRRQKESPWTQQLVPNQILLISEDISIQEENKLLACLDRNKDVFAWSSVDLISASRNII